MSRLEIELPQDDPSSRFARKAAKAGPSSRDRAELAERRMDFIIGRLRAEGVAKGEKAIARFINARYDEDAVARYGPADPSNTIKRHYLSSARISRQLGRPAGKKKADAGPRHPAAGRPGSASGRSAPLDVGRSRRSDPRPVVGPAAAARLGVEDDGDAAYIYPAAPLIISEGLGAWSRSGRPKRHQPMSIPEKLATGRGLDGAKDPRDWALVEIRSADDLGSVRTGMTYDKDCGTSCSYLAKARRTQFFEGPNEPPFADFMEMSPRCVAILFQPLEMVFRRKDGLMISKYPDVAIEFWNHAVRFGEIKSNQAWFDAPGVSRPLDRMDLALASVGLEPLLRIRGEPFRTEPVLKAQAEAMEARDTTFDPEADVHAATGVVRAAGGCARYGAVLAALGGRRALARDKLYAMLARRIVGFDLSSPPTADTPVTLPRPVTPYALREVLRSFVKRKP